MAIQAHLAELERKHEVLENELHDALKHLSTDDLQIIELKRRKLVVKDEIERSSSRNGPLTFTESYRQFKSMLVTATLGRLRVSLGRCASP